MHGCASRGLRARPGACELGSGRGRLSPDRSLRPSPGADGTMVGIRSRESERLKTMWISFGDKNLLRDNARTTGRGSSVVLSDMQQPQPPPRLAPEADGGIPVSCIMTSASTHDSQVAIPLGTLTAGRAESLYDLMDAAYHSIEIWAHSISLDHKPSIDVNPCSSVDMQEALKREKTVRRTLGLVFPAPLRREGFVLDLLHFSRHMAANRAKWWKHAIPN